MISITDRTNDIRLVYRVEASDCCYLEWAAWRWIKDWNKQHQDPVRERRSRFAGTFVRRSLGAGRVAHFPYEVERCFIAARIGDRLRSRMFGACRAYRGKSGNCSSLPVSAATMAIDFLGCSLSALVEQFESQMQDGMSWDNFGVRGWVIDHIAPVSSFDFRKISHARKACHHNNLRPCWELENILKGAKVPYVIE